MSFEPKHQTISGIYWTFLDYFVAKGSVFIGSVFLARILSPEDFGLLGMISVFIGLGNVLVNGGLTSSIIRLEKATEIDYSTIFYTNLSLSIFVYLLCFF